MAGIKRINTKGRSPHRGPPIRGLGRKLTLSAFQPSSIQKPDAPSQALQSAVWPAHLKRDALDPGAWNDEGVGGNAAANETEDPGYARECLQLGNDTCLTK